MGSWSESCALSGMDLGEGQEVILLSVFPQADEITGYPIMSAPMRGTYTGDGTLVLLQDCRSESGVLLACGSEVSADRDEKRQPIWLHADLYDVLAGLPMPGASLTIGEAADKHVESIQLLLDGQPEGPLIDIVDLGLKIRKTDFRPAIELSSILNAGVAFTSGLDLFHAKRAEDPGAIEEAIGLYRDSWILKTAEVALRKWIVPGIVGPQEGGLQTARAFAAAIVSAADRALSNDPTPGIGN